jgi:hypothetical protein
VIPSRLNQAVVAEIAKSIRGRLHLVVDVERTASNPPDRPANAPPRHVGSKAGHIGCGHAVRAVSGDAGLITRASASGSLNADVEGDGGVHPDGESANPSARRPTRPTEHADATIALSADVDDVRGGAGRGLSQLSPLPGIPTSADVVSAEPLALFEVEQRPLSPYEAEAA